MLTGNAAAETLCIGKVAEPCADSQISRPLTERHEGAAVLALTLIVTTAGFAWLGLWQHRRTQRIAPWNIVVIALTSSVAMGLVARAANIGGEIRHPEVRAAAAPAATEPTSRQEKLRAMSTTSRGTWIASETLHFVGLSLLIGVVTLIDLRALGVMKADSVFFRARAAVAVGGSWLRAQHRDGNGCSSSPDRSSTRETPRFTGN